MNAILPFDPGNVASAGPPVAASPSVVTARAMWTISRLIAPPLFPRRASRRRLSPLWVKNQNRSPVRRPGRVVVPAGDGPHLAGRHIHDGDVAVRRLPGRAQRHERDP